MGVVLVIATAAFVWMDRTLVKQSTQTEYRVMVNDCVEDDVVDVVEAGNDKNATTYVIGWGWFDLLLMQS